MVIPAGTWARLCNVSDDFKWIETEKFYVGSKLIEHIAGQSVGQTMRSWVELRKKAPHMFENIDVYIQPAGNVDSVIYRWQQEKYVKKFPGGVRQKDMFPGCLSEVSRLVTALSQELEAWIAGHMTSRLQLVDTDFAAVFKAIARQHKLQLVEEIQALASSAGLAADFECGPYEIMRITAGAHQEMKKRIQEKNLMLPALRRNGMLAYRPDFKNKRFVKVDDLPWGQAYPQGDTNRIPKEWFEERYSWLSSETGEPIEPDWSACDEEVEQMGKLPGDVQEAPSDLSLLFQKASDKLQMGDIDTQLLVHPSLRQEAVQTDMELLTFTQNHLVKRAEKNIKKRKRGKDAVAARDLKKVNVQKLIGENVAGVVESRSEKLSELSPVVRQAKAKAKVLSPAKLASLKLKASMLRKAKKKSAAKTSEVKEALKDAKEQEKIEKEKEKEKEQGPIIQGPLHKEQVRIVQRCAHYGLEAVVEKHVDGKVHFFGESGIGVWSCDESDVVKVSDFEKKDWANLASLNQVAKIGMIADLGIDIEDPVGEEIKVTALKATYIADQPLLQGVLLLKHVFPLPQSKVEVVDPLLLSVWRASRCHDFDDRVPDHVKAQHLKDVDDKLAKTSKVIQHFVQKSEFVYFPIWRPQHWTLLRVNFNTKDVKYWDSLPSESVENRAFAQQILDDIVFADEKVELPARCIEWDFQKDAHCGFFVLSYLEEDWRQLSGEGPAAQNCKHSVNFDKWRKKVKTIGQLLKQAKDSYLERRKKDLEKAKAKEEKDALKPAFQKKQKEQEEKKKQLEEFALSLASQGSSMTEEDLSPHARLQLHKAIFEKFGVCSKCRWSSGCYVCDEWKCKDYWLRKEKDAWLQKRLEEHQAKEKAAASSS